MRIVSADDLSGIFDFPDLIEALRAAFREGVIMPARHHHTIALPGEPDATLLLMPAWNDLSSGRVEERFLGVKVVSVYPGNTARGKPSISGSYLLMAGSTGEALAVIDGTALTLWRTAAASALAASYLARADATRLVMVGAGALAPFLISAHASVRPISDVLVWNRSGERAEAVASALSGRPYAVRATPDLEEAVCGADLVSCATLSTEPLVHGAWLQPGTHLDLVGAFTPTMRESDDEAVRRSRLYVDTRDGALKEAGDILQPLRAGAIAESDMIGDLFDLCRGTAPGRRSEDEITLFKSVGTALEDLAAATLAYARLAGREASHTA
jgi:ornithine cyclodeaminase